MNSGDSKDAASVAIFSTDQSQRPCHRMFGDEKGEASEKEVKGEARFRVCERDSLAARRVDLPPPPPPAPPPPPPPAPPPAANA